MKPDGEFGEANAIACFLGKADQSICIYAEQQQNKIMRLENSDHNNTKC